MNKKLINSFVFGVLLTLPLFVFAVFIPGGQPIGGLTLSFSQVINGVLNVMFPIFFALAVIIFLVAGYMFLTAQGDPDRLKTARDTVIWGVVAVIVALTAISIFFIVTNLFFGGVP